LAKLDYTERLRKWLEANNFTDDPFSSWEAERETHAFGDDEEPMLPFVFVDRPYLTEMLGDPSRPQAAVLMAGLGCGKTAACAMVAYLCRRGDLASRVLVVEYQDFDPLLDLVGRDLSQLEARDHIHIVLRYALRALLDSIPPENWGDLSEMDRRILMSYVYTFAGPIARWRASQIVEAEPARLDWDLISPQETLKTFAEIVTQLGREAIYVLVDRVDEIAETARVSTAVAMLRSLVGNQPLLAMPHLAFKFFVPTTVGTVLRQSVSPRAGQVLWRTIVWDDETLTHLLQERLRYYSGDNVLNFEELCTEEARPSVMVKLLKASRRSPRTLLRLCEEIVRYHVAHSHEKLISPDEITEVLQRSESKARESAAPIPEEVAIQQAVQSIPPDEGIWLDENERVWIDGRRLEERPAPLESKLLNALYERSETTLSVEQLIKAVWSKSEYADWEDDPDMPGQDETNLRKLVGRLRKRLERHAPGSGRRFIQSEHGRGYVLKRDAPKEEA